MAKGTRGLQFPGSDSPIPPVREEKLAQDDDEKVNGDEGDGDGDDEGEAALPKYSRENQGPRVGADPADVAAEMARVGDLERNLDTEQVVPCLFPRAVKLQDRGLMHSWEAGVHMVPVSIAGATPKDRHWWFKHNGVRHAGKVQARPAD